MTTRNLGVIVLAAGAGSRMKKAKPWLAWGDKSMAQTVIETAAELNPVRMVLVTGAHAPDNSVLKLPVNICHNPDWKKGMGTSICCGIKSFPKEILPAYMLILLADQPMISLAHLKRLYKAAQSSAIAASDYQGNPGVPAIFEKSYYSELCELRGDKGARELLRSIPKLIKISVSPKEILDIDTPELYEKYRP